MLLDLCKRSNALSWQHLITSPNPQILIARLETPEGIGQAIQQGHHVFIPLRRVSSDTKNLLPRIFRDAAEKSLIEMGLNYDEASRLATIARRNLSALRRKMAIAPNIRQPVWAKPNEARALLVPLLASSWDEAREGDQEALARLADLTSYKDLQSVLVRWVYETDPPLRQIGSIWTISSQEDAWRLIAHYLTDDDLKRFESLALEVLGEINPAFELPLEQRFLAAIYGKNLPHSEHLRNGISEMLALMATLSSEISFSTDQSGEHVARQIICKLMEKAKNSEMLWASLSHQLPLLAEAAPQIVLNAITNDLKKEQPILISLFQDKNSNSFSSSSPHTGLLWTLETLAWSPDYFSQAVLCLARLTRLEPGGTLANRPAGSLRDILLCWKPHTTASYSSRIKVLKMICQKEPDVAWNLLMSLLPQPYGSVTRTHQAKWRNWVPESPQSVTQKEYVEITTEILNMLISEAGEDINRWCSLITSARSLYRNQQEILLNNLESLNFSNFTSEDKAQISDCLRKEIIDYRDYSDADWAMPVKLVERLEEIFEKFQPDNLTDKHCWLFKHRVELAGKRDISWREREENVEHLRVEALQEILNTQGWDGVMQLAQKVKEPSLVGVTLAKEQWQPPDLGIFLQANFWSSNQWQKSLAWSYVSFNAYNQGEQWIKNCLACHSHRWNSEEYGEFLLCLSFTPYLLDKLDNASPETQRYFWSHIQRIDFLGVDHANKVLDCLLQFDRPHLAVNEIDWVVKETPDLFTPERIADVLEISLQTSPRPDFDAGSFAHCSATLMDYLEKTPISRDRFIKLEMMYFQIHEHYRYPHLLFEKLSNTPEFFIEILQYAFRSENEPINDNHQTNESLNPSVSKFAWDLLEKWKKMPGTMQDGSVNGEALTSWVRQVCKLATECDRLQIADIYIGKSLAFSPVDPDGIWPHTAVRNLIEELENETIESGLSSQIFNNRGCTIRFPTDGGEQERSLVERYEESANQLKDQWPRTATVLRNLADDYRYQASGQDINAEITQDFWR